MITNIRKPLRGDLNYLLDIDLKCFEDTLSLDEWRERLDDDNYSILIGTLHGKAVGFIIWQDNTIIRFAVKPTYRHMGIGAQLLAAVENTLIQRGKTLVTIQVPESLCVPGKTIDVSGWLRKHHFKAEKLLTGATFFCGVQEDLICFNKLLSGTITHA